MDLEEAAEPRSAPVSPFGHYFNSSVLSVSIIAVLEFKVPIDEVSVVSSLKHVLLPVNPRFSSIMVNDNKGSRRWRKVEVRHWDHVKVPTFPSETASSDQLYDDCFNDYLSEIAAREFDEAKPLWEIHIVKYPTINGAGSLVFKIHHALGDGFSLMGTLLSTFRRSDDPSLPLTFPTARKAKSGQHPRGGRFNYRSVSNMFVSVFNGFKDFYWSILMSTVITDDLTPIRSENPQLYPISISTTSFSLNDVKQIKAKLGSATVNDVVVGTIFLGCRLYMRSMEQVQHKAGRSTALVLLNTRMFSRYESVAEMTKPNTKSAYGNRFTFLEVTVPKPSDSEFSNPLEFVTKTRKMIRRKRNSIGIYLNAWLLGIITKIRGTEAAAKYFHGALTNTSMSLTNMIGPTEEMAIANHPIKGFYFTVAGIPQSLMVGIMTYNGTLRIAIAAEKGFVDIQKLDACIESAFEMILKAAAQIPFT